MERPDTSITERWQQILSGDTDEYATFVDQYKNLITSIAYSCTGDLSGSEDIAQETFLVAWQSRHEIREPEKLAGWLSSIARNLARQWVRKRSSRSWPSTQDNVGEVMQLEPHPSEKLVSQEEQELVWRSLEAIPENYREVMVLYYRESHSIVEVAMALEITEDAVRQRLSRGRGLLRAEVERTIEQTLTNSRPTARFTSSVIALITMGVGSSLAKGASTAAASAAATGVLSKTLAQGAAVAVTQTAATGAMIGAAGAVTGILGGLGGTWLGTRVPQLLAPTMTERRLLEREGRLVWRLTCVYLSFLLFTVVLGLLFGHHAIARAISVVGYAVTTLSFVAFTVVRGILMNRQIKKIRESIRPEDDPNPSWLKDKLGTSGLAGKPKLLGRRLTSRMRLLGWPIYDFQVSDPIIGQVKAKPLHAKGWIAVGDKATGFLAVGNFARGIVAIGGVCFGFVSFGALSIGLLTLGGLSMGLLATGGLAIGHSSIGGAALGWQSMGGVAIGIHSANGGLAIGGTLAEGGKAISWKYAVGGSAVAPEANSEAARVACRESWVSPFVGTELILKDQKRFIINQLIFSLAIPVFVSLLLGGISISMYRRVKAVE